MFGRIVNVDGREIWVPCTPSTPLVEVLRLAADILARDLSQGARP